MGPVGARWDLKRPPPGWPFDSPDLALRGIRRHAPQLLHSAAVRQGMVHFRLRHRSLLLAALALLPLATTIGPAHAHGHRAAPHGDRLLVTVRHAGRADGTYVLRCHPAGGTHPAAGRACAVLERRTVWGRDPFAPVPPGRHCTLQYGGPAAAHVTGRWAGRPVDAWFDRGDGCRIAGWDALVPLLPNVRS
ncbi:SSI family serine proteinase inhibitor [Streptomyces sp. NPDC001848]|uniref:SSI family serine proteinase inhibitor n=1 Tax=Streptomyces sp. NPDC001848 TaxID=3364618 RepID=UPI0036B7B9AA